MGTLKTIFGGNKLTFDGYVYITDRNYNEATYWRCERRRRMTTFRLDGSMERHPSIHNHPTDLSSIEAAKTIEEIESKAILTDETQGRRHGGHRRACPPPPPPPPLVNNYMGP